MKGREMKGWRKKHLPEEIVYQTELYRGETLLAIIRC
jgi:hypothetical protein